MREIPEQDREYLCSMFRTESLPADVVETYWNFKWFRDVLDAGRLTTAELATIAVLSGRKATPPSENPTTAFDQLVRGEADRGDTIMVRWRNKDREAEFVEVSPRGTVYVRFNDEIDQRELQPDKILAIPQKA